MGVLNYNKHVCISLVLLSLVTLFCSIPVASFSANWPTNGWQMTSPEAQGMKSSVLADMMEFVQKHEYNIDSIAVIRNGYLVLDAYFFPFSRNQKHSIHSCTKSIMSALIGIAIDKGYIKDVKQPILEFFPEKTVFNLDASKKPITLENLLTMSSGLKCRDTGWYEWEGMRAMTKSDDWVQYVLNLPMEKPPGEVFVYCNGASYLLSAIIQNTTNMRTIDFAKENLFNPLGISDILWDTSPQGIDIGWGRMWLRPIDMARFGWLYLSKGKWDDKQIVFSEWVETSTKGYVEAKLFDQYGYQWWVASEGYYIAFGANGQYIFIVPDKNIVAVFTGYLTGRGYFKVPNRLLKTYIIPAASSQTSLPTDSKGEARLKALISSASESRPFIWTSEKDGIADSGVFKRTATPSFQFTYPTGSKKANMHGNTQIMRMKTPLNEAFSVMISDIPSGVKLEDFGPDHYASWLHRVGCLDINVISNKEVVLNCGTNAYKTKFTWIWKSGEKLTTLLVSAYKDGKSIGLSIHTWRDPELSEPIVQSLMFN